MAASTSTKEPGVVKFAFTDFKVVNDKKWSAKCTSCGEVITETRGVSSGFNRHIERKHEHVYNS